MESSSRPHRNPTAHHPNTDIVVVRLKFPRFLEQKSRYQEERRHARKTYKFIKMVSVPSLTHWAGLRLRNSRHQYENGCSVRRVYRSLEHMNSPLYSTIIGFLREAG